MKIQVQKIQNNTNYNPQFNGRFCMYNYHKKRWFFKSTTPKEDKILSDLFNSFPLTLNFRNSCNTYSKMEYSYLLEYINLFSKQSKEINLPKLSETRHADVDYFKTPWKNNSQHTQYTVVAPKAFKIIHSFDK